MMKKQTICLKTTIMVTGIAVLLVSCATTGSGDNSRNRGLSGEDARSSDCVAASAIGGLLGGLLAGGKDRVRGAVAGAGLGLLACMTVKANTRQTKTAQQVEDEVRAANRGRLPPEPTVKSYLVNVSPQGMVRRGNTVQIQSQIEVAPGSQTALEKVSEELILQLPNGQMKTIMKQPVAIGAGAFTNNFSFTLPQGVDEGSYVLRTNLYVNEKLIRSGNTGIEVVKGPEDQTLVAAL